MAKTVTLKIANGFQDITKIVSKSGKGKKKNDEEQFPVPQPEKKETTAAAAAAVSIDGKPDGLSFEEYINGIEWEKNIEDQVFSDAQMVAKMFTDIIQGKSKYNGGGDEEDNPPEKGYFDFYGTGEKVVSVDDFSEPVFWNDASTTVTTFSNNSSECTITINNGDHVTQNGSEMNVLASHLRSSAPNLKLGSLEEELDLVKVKSLLDTKRKANGLTCTCNVSRCQASRGFRVRRYQNAVSLMMVDAMSSSSSSHSAASFATTGSSVYGTLSSESFVHVEDQGGRRKVCSPIKILSAHNFGSRLGQEVNNLHKGRERKQNSDYGEALTSSSTLSYTTGSIYRIHSNDSLLDNEAEQTNLKLSSFSSHLALSWSTPNIQFSCKPPSPPLKCRASTNSLQTSRGEGKRGKGGVHRALRFKSLGSPVLLAWHLILLVTILHGNTSSIIPILEKLIC